MAAICSRSILLSDLVRTYLKTLVRVGRGEESKSPRTCHPSSSEHSSISVSRTSLMSESVSFSPLIRTMEVAQNTAFLI